MRLRYSHSWACRDKGLQQALCKAGIPVAAMPSAQARMVLQHNHDAQVVTPSLVRQHLRSSCAQIQRSLGADVAAYAGLLAYSTAGV